MSKIGQIHHDTAPERADDAEREVARLTGDNARLRAALQAFLDYYDQAGIGDCTEADEDDRDDGFDGDEVFNVRHGREALKAELG